MPECRGFLGAGGTQSHGERGSGSAWGYWGGLSVLGGLREVLGGLSGLGGEGVLELQSEISWLSTGRAGSWWGCGLESILRGKSWSFPDSGALCTPESRRKWGVKAFVCWELSPACATSPAPWRGASPAVPSAGSRLFPGVELLAGDLGASGLEL